MSGHKTRAVLRAPWLFAHVEGLDYTLPPGQFTLLNAACNPDTSCDLLARYVNFSSLFPVQRCYNP